MAIDDSLTDIENPISQEGEEGEEEFVCYCAGSGGFAMPMWRTRKTRKENN